MDAYLVMHGSVTLSGLKTASLFTYPYTTRAELESIVEHWNRILNVKGVYLYILQCSQSRALIYLCRVSQLERDLQRSGVLDTYQGIAFGCPSMGAEVLEESTFQPMWDDVLPKLKGRKIALFGSYGWGDGEWMRNWEEACTGAGAMLVSDCVICNDAPDDAAKAACQGLGKALA